MPQEHDIWQWQKYGTAWKGVGLYHITLKVSSREPLLGDLVIPDNDPTKAYVERTPLGEALINVMFDTQHRHKEVQILHFTIMPDHLHTIWYVRRPMKRGILSVAQGFWTGAKKLGRTYSYAATVSRENHKEGQNSKNKIASSLFPTVSREDYKGNTLRLQLGDEAYYALSPLFTEKPFIRPMRQYRQLPTTIRYLDMNPQRLATKRLKPGFFRAQEGIEIGGHIYTGIGNLKLLMCDHYMPVHVRRTMVEEAMHGDNKRLRDYMNGCVLAARKGAVMVSPFTSDKEKEVMTVLLAEEHPIIYIADNGFHDYYKPSDGLFDAVAEGRVLILSPWEYDAHKRHVTRSECVAMNQMAEEICASSLLPTDSRENDKEENI